jgi:hypothetical protein
MMSAKGMPMSVQTARTSFYYKQLCSTHTNILSMHVAPHPASTIACSAIHIVVYGSHQKSDCMINHQLCLLKSWHPDAFLWRFNMHKSQVPNSSSSASTGSIAAAQHQATFEGSCRYHNLYSHCGAPATAMCWVCCLRAFVQVGGASWLATLFTVVTIAVLPHHGMHVK